MNKGKFQLDSNRQVVIEGVAFAAGFQSGGELVIFYTGTAAPMKSWQLKPVEDRYTYQYIIDILDIPDTAVRHGDLIPVYFRGEGATIIRGFLVCVGRNLV